MRKNSSNNNKNNQYNCRGRSLQAEEEEEEKKNNNDWHYLNNNYCDNGNSSNSPDNQTIGKLQIPTTKLNEKLCQENLTKKNYNNFFINSNKINVEMPANKTKEKYLSDFGFNTTEIKNWDGIIQPIKPDLFILLKKLITTYDKTNVKIQIDDAIFNCHMIILQCYSDYFSNKTLEQIINLPSDKVTPNSFIMIYDWMLETEPKVQREGILELFNAAQYLRIKDLVDQCWVCIDDDKRFSEDAAFILYLEARKLEHELIQQLMLTRVFKFFLTLVASKEFLLMSLKEVCTLLQSNSIGVNSETEVLMSAVRWLSYDWLEREKYMLEIMKCVRFGLMTPWQLVEFGRNADSPEIQRVVENPEVKKMIDDGLSYVTTKYWYRNNLENQFHFLERLNLIAPVERQWVCDKAWIEHFQCPNQLYGSYQSFLDYLEMIKSMKSNHWKSLTYHEDNPNNILLEGDYIYSLVSDNNTNTNNLKNNSR